MIFISHNSRDKNVAREIGVFLVAEGVDVWFDEWEIAAGDSITEAINSGLAGATHLLIVWSANASKANWVRRELAAALNRSIATGTPKIIPIILDETPLPELLRDIRYLRYAGGTEEDRREIVKAVQGRPPSENLIRTIVRKYHEVITDQADPVFGLKACPRCGSTQLKGSSAIDYEGDEAYYFLRCTECEWSDWTQ
jgi:hypothetical protein